MQNLSLKRKGHEHKRGSMSGDQQEVGGESGGGGRMYMIKAHCTLI
jgi:hypothetical protein